MREDTKVVVDDTTIYEIDLNCYDCLSEQERRTYFPYAAWMQGVENPDRYSERNPAYDKR